MVWTTTSSTRTRLSSSSYSARSSSSVGGRSCSVTAGSIGRPRLAHRVGVDVALRRAAVEGAPLALRAVERGQHDVDPVLAAHRLGPRDHALEGRAGVLLLAAVEVD